MPGFALLPHGASLGTIKEDFLFWCPMTTGQTESYAFFSSRPIWDPSPHPQASVSPHWFGGDMLGGDGVGGSQFGRGDSHCGTLGTYCMKKKTFVHQPAATSVSVCYYSKSEKLNRNSRQDLKDNVVLNNRVVVPRRLYFPALQ